MFESVASEPSTRRRRHFYESLPVSVAAHAAAAAAVLLLGSWKITFPQQSPRLTMMYSLALPPTPPPPPPARAAQKPDTPKSEPAPKRVDPAAALLAPTVIPDEIPVVSATEPPPPTEPSPDVEPVGDPNGVDGGVGEGVGGSSGGTGVSNSPGGLPGGAEGGIPADTVVIQRFQPLPMSMTPLSMVYPFYPEEARIRGWEDAVTVRYIIGRDGRVRDVQVLEAPHRPIFESIVVKAIRHWRFRPLIKQGVAQEVIHELVVNFRLNQGVG